MAGLTHGRNTLTKEGDLISIPVAASVTIYAGALTVINSTGFAAPGSTATGLTVAGRAETEADNASGSNGAVNVTVRRGVFKYDNSGTDPVGEANLYGVCYIVDDHTVSKTNGSGTQSIAGVVLEVDSDGIWIDTTICIPVTIPTSTPPPSS